MRGGSTRPARPSSGPSRSNPDFADAHNNLGNVCKDQGRLDEASPPSAEAQQWKPDDARFASNLLFNLHAHPDHDAQALLAEHRRWASRHATPLAAQIRPHDNDRSPDRTLRVGYLSPDLRAHAVGQMLLGLLAHHDPGLVEIHAYADVRTPDRVSRELKALTHHWLDTAGLTDSQLADRIRADRIDILVDLALHTAGNRMLVFARKPAPVQVTMLGLPTTTGLDTIDYRLTDPYLDPPGATDADYTEQSIRLPHCYWIFHPPDDSPPVSTLPAESNGYVTFGCLNQFAKVTAPALDLWMKVLQALPDVAWSSRPSRAATARPSAPCFGRRDRRRAPRVRRQGPAPRVSSSGFRIWTWASTLSPTMAIPAHWMHSGWASR